MSDLAYHYPPDLMDLLIDTIPLLCRSKQDVLTFFRGAGVPDSTTAMLRMRVATDKDSISKYEITRTVLKAINEGGDRTLAQRREVIKRVTEFHDFSPCWETDRLKAGGLVASVRDLVNVRDTFTRMSQERDTERKERLRKQEAEAEAKRRKRQQRDDVRRRLAGLGSMTDPVKRGLAFEVVLNDIFKLDGLSVREAFTIRNEDGQAQEQIDGVVDINGKLILVEAKWHSDPIGTGDVAAHLIRLYSRADCYGLFVSFSRFTEPAVETCKTALTKMVVVLAEVHELLMLLEDPDASMSNWLRAKIRAASLDRMPLFRPDLLTITGSGS